MAFIRCGLCLMLACCGDVSACTVFTVTHGRRVLVGNNEDAPYYFPDKMWFVPASREAHGRVCFGFYSFAQGGMNDQGLFMDWAVTPAAGKPIADKPPLEGAGVERILATCATVEDAIAVYQKFAYTGNDAHFMIADKTGSSIVGEWVDGEFRVVRKSGPYQLITNFLLSEPERGNYPCRRFETASRMMERAGKISVEQCAAALKAVSADWGEGGTKYSNVYDLHNREVYTYYRRNFDKPLKINLAKELRKGLREVDLKEFFETGEAALAVPRPPLLKALSAAEVLERSLQARGGRDAALRIHSLQATGKLSIPWSNITGTATFVAARPNKFRLTVELDVLGRYERAFDGKTAWEAPPGQRVRILRDEMAKHACHEAEFFAWVADPERYQANGKARACWFEAKACYELTLRTKAGKQTRHFFDAGTCLLTGVIEDFATATGPAWGKTLYAHYKTVDGFLLPTRIQVKAESDEYVLHLTSLTPNQVKDSAFRPPPGAIEP